MLGSACAAAEAKGHWATASDGSVLASAAVLPLTGHLNAMMADNNTTKPR